MPDKHPTELSLLHEFIARTSPRCPECRAPLAPMPDDRCPTCRSALILGLGMAEPASRHIVAGTVALALGFGFNASLASIVLASNIPGVVWNRVIPVFIGSVVMGFALLWWYWKRSRVRVLPIADRRLAVAFCWLLALSFPTWLAFNIVRAV
jgi:hypothetical protein